MSDTPRILAFGGSLRQDSFNHKLAAAFARATEAAGAESRLIRLRDYPLPVFDADLESETGIPRESKELSAHIAWADGLIVSCPEYNSSLTAALKNAIDWVSRKDDQQPGFGVLAGKPILLVATSTGGRGGLRGLPHARDVFSNIGMVVVPPIYAVSFAAKVFAADGSIADDAIAEQISKLSATMVETTKRLQRS